MPCTTSLRLWTPALCCTALLWLNGCGASRTGAPWSAAPAVVGKPKTRQQALQEKMWVTYGGKDGEACTGNGATQAGSPMFVLNVTANAPAGGSTLKGEARGIDPVA